MIKKIGIAGDRGFIGSSLAKIMLESEFEVFGFNSSNPTIVEPQKMNSLLRNVDTLVWAATKVNPIIAENKPELLDRELKDWGEFLRYWEKEKKKKARLVFLSSGGCVYSGRDLPFKEEFPDLGINAYGLHKVQMEKILQNSITNWTILRLSNVYGLGQESGRGQGVIAEWRKSLKENHFINVFGSLDSFRDYIHIKDACEAIILSTGPEGQDQVFNVGSGEKTTLRELLDHVEKISKTNFQLNIFEGRQSDRDGYHLDISRFKNTFGWSPKVSLEKGLREILGY
jgi:UDP-glucose 4-epimerase